MEREDRGRLAFSEISNYDEFLSALELAGMTPGGVNGEGVFTLCGFFGSAVRWHTGDPDTDPWEWRMRVLSEGRGIAYGKFYYGKAAILPVNGFPIFWLCAGERAVLKSCSPAMRRPGGFIP